MQVYEYYYPDAGVGVNKSGFQIWNLLLENVFLWLKDNM